MSILIFLLVLFVLVLVHEWGHFIVAKKTGMRVDEFGIGFPPKLFGFTWHGTLYTLNLFPIGGFVKIFGENAEDAAEGTVGTDSFTSKSKWAQAAVLVAGVTMNIILAWFLFVFVFVHGVPTIVEEGKQTQNAHLIVQEVLPDSPAGKAGIPQGATIVSYGDGSAAKVPSAFKAYTKKDGNEAVSVTYAVGEKQTTVSVMPIVGLIKESPDAKAIGVSVALIDNVSEPLPDAVIEATKNTYSSLIAVAVGLGSLFFHMAKMNADLSQVAGPVGMVGMVGQAAHFGLSSVLLFMAMISLNLAVVNMLPLPALDGGRLLFVAIEAVTRKPINPVWVGRVNIAGFGLLLLLMAVITINDIYKLF